MLRTKGPGKRPKQTGTKAGTLQWTVCGHEETRSRCVSGRGSSGDWEWRVSGHVANLTLSRKLKRP